MTSKPHPSDADVAERRLAQLPSGLVPVASQWRQRGLDLLSERTDLPQHLDQSTVIRDLLAPVLLETDWPGPAAPLRVGKGWVQADLTDDDRDAFDRLRSTMVNATSEELAAAAQSWRLPVTPYRQPSGRSSTTDPMSSARGPLATLDLSAVAVLDLTSLWAGPLCTRLLADAGATVTKVDPSCRPDGFRERPHLYAELNSGKTVVDLDLRQDSDRDTFEQLVASADLLIDSFTRRVLPNLGYSRQSLQTLNPDLATISIVGFPAETPEADWLTYGSGIHAISGLGLTGGVARAAAVAYPDPLTGYAAFAAALELLDTAEHVEISLYDAGLAVAGATGASDDRGSA